VSNDGDVGGVSAEHGDVLLQPVEGRYLVHEPVVSRRAEVPVRVGVQEPCNDNNSMKQSPSSDADGR
jgi:hypothetical protein